MNEKNIVLVELENGKNVYIDGDSINKGEAIEIAKKLIDSFGQMTPDIKAVLLYEWNNSEYTECNHVDTIEQAKEELKMEHIDVIGLTKCPKCENMTVESKSYDLNITSKGMKRVLYRCINCNWEQETDEVIE